MNNPSKELERSVVTAAIIECNKCAAVASNLDFVDNHEEAAQGFYDDGWRVVDGLAICGSCVEKLKKKKK